MFEIFYILVMYLVLVFVLFFYVFGCKDGIVFQSGFGVSYVVFISEGFVFCQNVLSFDLVGMNLIDYFIKILGEWGKILIEYRLVRDVKEMFCYVVQDFEKEMSIVVFDLSLQRSYEFFDGQFVIFGDERFRCFEVLFQFFMVDNSLVLLFGIYQFVFEFIVKCNEDIRNEMYVNIVLFGGFIMFKGIVERMQKEIIGFVGVLFIRKVKIIVFFEFKYFVWIGGLILVLLLDFQLMWIFK